MFLRIIQGDVVKGLRELDDESVNLIFTSPPYWGLRYYGDLANKIWGGDPNCKHEWVDMGKKKLRGTDSSPRKEVFKEIHLSHGMVCKKCGAWYGQLGLEPTLDMYIEHLLEITAELKRVLHKDGVLFWNHGDSYGGSLQGYGASKPSKTGFQKPAGIDNRYSKTKPPISYYRKKCMVMQNYRLALRMVDEQGWTLRNIIIWYKPNHMPSSVKDRFTNTYEPIFMFVKSRKYYFNLDAVRVPAKIETWGLRKDLLYLGEDKKDYLSAKAQSPSSLKKRLSEKLRRGEYKGKNPGDLWSISTKPFKGAHFATFPVDLVEMGIKSACPPGGVVLDPFMGSGTTLLAAMKHGCSAIGIEINPEYVNMAMQRLMFGKGMDIEYTFTTIV